VPTTDDSVRVKLTARARGKHARPEKPSPTAPQPKEQSSTGETLPNPY
jgi:hypothetical protein